jgi:integrase
VNTLTREQKTGSAKAVGAWWCSIGQASAVSYSVQHIKAQISEAVIKRHASKAVRQISDTRYPVKFRYSTDRHRGSWYIVHRGKWQKVADYPAINAKLMIDRVPEIVASITLDPSVKASASRFETVADVLCWYRDRMVAARYLSTRRRSAISSIVDRHLLPKLGEHGATELRHEHIDADLIQPMQESYSLAYTRQVFDILRIAFKQAHKMRQLPSNPIGGFSFGDFISVPIKAREGRIRRNQIPKVLAKLKNAEDDFRMLAVLMLLHGTRIGETKEHRWDWIDWEQKDLSIPEQVTKTREGHTVPLTDTVIALLKRYRAYQEYHGYKGVYLFPNGKGGCISDAKASRMMRFMGNGEWTAHDLRKLARTCWADLGVDYMVSERLLNHKLTKLDQAYIHTYVEQQKRVALEKYHGWLRKMGLSALLSEL